MASISPYTLWLMGPTSSGKSTIAGEFVSALRERDVCVLHYDGDEIRGMFGKNLSFDEPDRGKVVETLSHLANKANGAGVNVVVSALTAHQSARDFVEKNIPNLLVASVECPISVCVDRDPKGLYEKARRGEINTLIGYNSEYIPPASPAIILDANNCSVEENIQHLFALLGVQ